MPAAGLHAGRLIDHLEVEKRASARQISLRTGCFCNPGVGEVALDITRDDLNRCFASADRMTIDTFRSCLVDKGSGAVRVSFGEASTFADANALLELVQSFRAARSSSG